MRVCRLAHCSCVINAPGEKTDIASLAELERYIKQDVPKDIGFPHDHYVNSYSIRSSDVVPEDPSKVDAGRRRQMTMMNLSELEAHTELAQGRWFVNSKGDFWAA